MAEICILGLGYVGLPTASLLANAGFEVLGVDIDSDIVVRLQSGRTRLKEPGLAALLSAALGSGNLEAATEVEPSDTFIMCVPTPITAEKCVDLSAVHAAAKAISPVLREGNLVILESTSPVGTTRDVVAPLLAQSGLVPGKDFDLCYCPERVLPGNTVHELISNDRILGGFTADSAKRAEAIYERFSQGKLLLTDDRTAEMCKLMENTYRDVNIAVANVFASIAEQAGVNVWEAIRLANCHPRVNILKPGPGVGGHCIPVDPWFFIESFPIFTDLLRSAREVNDNQSNKLLERLLETGQLAGGNKVALLGAAYKADVDDPRESPAALFVRAAARHGITTAVHDPVVTPGESHGLKVSNDLAACLENADAAVLLTEHKMYRSISSQGFAERMRGRLIGDARNWLNHSALRRAGFTVIRLGVPSGLDDRSFRPGSNRSGAKDKVKAALMRRSEAPEQHSK